MTSIIVFIKFPEPGKVKTRLGAQIGNELACACYRLFLGQTFDLLKATSAETVIVAYEPQSRAAEFGKIIPVEFESMPQCAGTLGDRMTHAFTTAFEQGSDQVIAFGSDSPTVPHSYIEDAIKRLSRADITLGASEDGGYYLIGLKKMHRRLFEGIAWSSENVLSETLARAEELKLEVGRIPEWYDIDDLETLQRAARDDQSGRISALLTQVEVT